jgi:hypothetical protein
MLSRVNSNFGFKCVVALVLVGWAAFDPVHAQTWDGGGADNNWTTGLNWVGDAAPTERQELGGQCGGSLTGPFHARDVF